MTIREDIIEYLNKNNRKTIKEIADNINAQENVVRTKIYDKKYGLITKGTVVSVSHKQRTNYFSLKENAESPDILLRDLHEIMNKRMDFTEKPTDIEIKTIKNIEEIIK